MPCRVEPNYSDLERKLSKENFDYKSKVDALETELCMLREYLLNKQDFEDYKSDIFKKSQILHRREDVEERITKEHKLIESRLKSKQTYKGTDFELLFAKQLDSDIDKAKRKIEFLRGLTDEQLLNRVYLNDKYLL